MAKVESLREQMPQVAALMDRLRATFGVANINAVIRAGIKGEPVFYASENGHTIGTKWPDPKPAAPVDLAGETNRERHYRQARENYAALMASGPAVQTSTHNVVPKGKGKRK